MKILIIEDEARAANRIKTMLTTIGLTHEVIAIIESVQEGIDFLKNNSPDLIISDIQLADGLSFEIYNIHTPNCPIIFTTAFDQYAITAFETNGIDYLLKPIKEERLKTALEKVKNLTNPTSLSDQENALKKLLEITATTHSTKTYKTRFMIKVGSKIKTIPTTEIKAFYSLKKGTYLVTENNRNYVVENSLEQIIELLNPQLFFKISRKYIVNINAAKEIIAYTNSRLKLVIEGIDDAEIIVSREKVNSFKTWLDQ